MMRYIRGFLIKKVPIFMVKEQDNRDLKGQKSPEYQGKTAIKEFQYGLKAARRAPQFSKRQDLQFKASYGVSEKYVTPQNFGSGVFFDINYINTSSASYT